LSNFITEHNILALKFSGKIQTRSLKKSINKDDCGTKENTNWSRKPSGKNKTEQAYSIMTPLG